MIIDAHTHAFPDMLAERAIAALREEVRSCGLDFPDTAYTDGTAGGLTGIMDKAGVDRCLLLPVATKPGQGKGINRWTAEFLKGGRIIPFGAIFPDGEYEENLEKIARAGYKGVKIHGDYQGFYADESRMIDFYRKCGELSLVVVMHSGVDPASPKEVHVDPVRMARVLDKVGGVTFVMAHMGGIGCEWEASKLLKGSGVYVDTAYTAGRFSGEEIGELIRAFGADRVLFGSDCPWNDPSDDIALINSAGLSDKEREFIFSGNLGRLLKIDAVPHTG
ncbi:MAG: amidohydrolase family protein [Oscillospiraceae bacterium]|nr:amidohydrolase family protein [Oscillospiraceae bacterium]